MAPKCDLLRHQLGEATTSFQRNFQKTALLFCLLLVLFTPQIEARTERAGHSWGKLSTEFIAHERPSYGESLATASQSSSHKSTSPVGRWSNQSAPHIPNHPAVQRYIKHYKGPGRITFVTGLERSWPYLHVMADILESYGVPAEIVFVVLVESCFVNCTSSPDGTAGYWQLLGSTARSLGLRVDRWVDERMDPIKSTQAAARYLMSFYEKYRSWPLAIAAYNAGDGPVSRAVRECRSRDFWVIWDRGYLPKRTREYVPHVLAAMYLARDLEVHDFKSPRHLPMIDFEPIWVSSSLKLQQVASWANVPVRDIKDLNPSLRLDQLPPDRGFTLRLPTGARERFNLAYESFLQKSGKN